MRITLSQEISWLDLFNYTCNDLLSSIDIFYNISATECQSSCLSLYPMECTRIAWYEYIKPTGNDVPRCYLFGESCELITETEKPVITSFWYYNISNDINCVNYPYNWKDIYFDDCHTYSSYNWCNYAYNSSTTAILSYQDRIYGLDAINVCCHCNGGLFNYDNTYLFEPIWKSTTKLKIYPSDDFICESIDFSSTLINDIDIFQKDRLNVTQFVGLCQYLHSTLHDQYKLLLSINTENNDIIYRKDIHPDFVKLKEFDCVKSLYFYNVTICNHTDYNNLYPFIIDINTKNIYINNHYINIETFIYHLPSTNLYIDPYCSFSKLLNTTYPTLAPTKEPTYEPTLEPTSNPSQYPSTNPTQPSFHPTRDPTSYPSNEPTTEPTKDPTIDPTADPTIDPTSNPSNNPTIEPSVEPTTDPTDNPTALPTTGPTRTPSFYPTIEPTKSGRRLLSDSMAYFKTNIMAILLCEISYTTEPTEHPTVYPTEWHDISTTAKYIVTINTDLIYMTLDNDKSGTSSDDVDVGIIVGIAVGGLCFCCIIIVGLVYYFIRKRSNREAKTDNDVEIAEIVDRVRKKYRGSSYNGKNERKEERSKQDAPKEFLCPISFELMTDPMMVKQSGWTYEKSEIERWIKENGNDPNTREQCTVNDLIPNRTLRDAITRWKQEVGYTEYH